MDCGRCDLGGPDCSVVQRCERMGPGCSRGGSGCGPRSGSGGSVRAKSQSWLVAPKGTYVVGTRLRFLNSDATPFSAESAKMTDLALFDVTARASLGDKLEFGIGMSVLAKEITGTDEPIFQGGYSTLRVGLAKWAECTATKPIPSCFTRRSMRSTYSSLTSP